MQPILFDFITGIIKQRSGLSLTQDKTYLLESRLQPVGRMHGFDTVEELILHVQRTHQQDIIHDIVQAMTTNETMFFRDNKPFERFRDLILPRLKEQHPERKHLRIWSSACSSGQEPYTLGMCLNEEGANYPGYSFDIIATDLCEKALEKAQRATYTQFEVQRGMPIQLLVKYFEQRENNQWHVKDAIHKMVRFHVHNLLEDPARFGQFDVIFCRNVLIYFDEATKRHVLERLISVLRPPGYMVLGSAETVIGITDKLVMLTEAPGVYVLRA